MKRSMPRLLILTVSTFATVLTLSARPHLQESTADHREPNSGRHVRDLDDDDDRRQRQGSVKLPTGQIVTPTAIDDAVQQYLNPGLPDYPAFIAGEAVRSRLSPDGTTLAVITAGQNSLYTTKTVGTTNLGTLDVANSTQ